MKRNARYLSDLSKKQKDVVEYFFFAHNPAVIDNVFAYAAEFSLISIVLHHSMTVVL